VVLQPLMNVVLRWLVINPVTYMAEITERVSMGVSEQPEYIHPGTDEPGTDEYADADRKP
jgi:hypothetical protein